MQLRSEGNLSSTNHPSPPLLVQCPRPTKQDRVQQRPHPCPETLSPDPAEGGTQSPSPSHQVQLAPPEPLVLVSVVTFTSTDMRGPALLSIFPSLLPPQ